MEDTVCALYCDYVSFFLRGKTKSVFPSDVATSWLAPRAASCTSLFCTHTAYQSSHQQSTATSMVTRKSRLVQKHNAELMIHETNVFKIFIFFFHEWQTWQICTALRKQMSSESNTNHITPMGIWLRDVFKLFNEISHKTNAFVL